MVIVAIIIIIIIIIILFLYYIFHFLLYIHSPKIGYINSTNYHPIYSH